VGDLRGRPALSGSVLRPRSPGPARRGPGGELRQACRLLWWRTASERAGTARADH
jgi:hypothetical protein